MTKPIQRHRLKCGPKPKVDIAKALPVLAESQSIKAAARVLGISHITLRKAVDEDYVCPRCTKPGVRQYLRTVCVDCYALEEVPHAAKCANCGINPKYETRAICKECISKQKRERKSAGWTNASPAIKKHAENLSEPFPAKHKLGNSADWLSRPLMGAST